MKTTELLARRQPDWKRLERFCAVLAQRRRAPAELVSEFSRLYRAVCADLALAEAYQIPQETIEYLHRLVGRAHNVYYRTQISLPREWFRLLFRETPAKILTDRMFWVVFLLFWTTFLLGMFLAARDRGFAETVVGAEMLTQMERMYAEKPSDWGHSTVDRVGFYIQHNVGIALNCFALGLLFMVPGLLTLVFNSVLLGTVFGYMSTTAQSPNFFEFVTAHGPFELTGIVLAASCGARLGFSMLKTNGLTRVASLRAALQDATPKLVVAVAFFVIAAGIEGLISPSALPYPVKLGVALLSVFALVGYIGILGKINLDYVRFAEHADHHS